TRCSARGGDRLAGAPVSGGADVNTCSWLPNQGRYLRPAQRSQRCQLHPRRAWRRDRRGIVPIYWSLSAGWSAGDRRDVQVRGRGVSPPNGGVVLGVIGPAVVEGRMPLVIGVVAEGWAPHQPL